MLLITFIWDNFISKMTFNSVLKSCFFDLIIVVFDLV